MNSRPAIKQQQRSWPLSLRGLARIVCLAALAGLLSATGCRGAAKPTDTLIYGRGSDSDTLDPANTNSGEAAKVLVNIFDTLVTYADDSMELVPSLAESWDMSDDGLTWTFHLRQGVRFHDGTLFDADAVLFSLNRMIDPQDPNAYGASQPYAPLFSNVVDIRKVDNKTVEFVLAHPSSLFLENLATFATGIVSPTAVTKYKAQFGNHPIGTGPFQLAREEDWKRDEELLLTAFADHWRGPPGVKKVIFVPISESSLRAEKLRRGQLHIADNLPPQDLDSLLTAEGVEVKRQMGLNVGYLSIQIEKPPLDNLKLREALSYAIDREALVEAAYAGYAVPAVSLVAPSIDGHAALTPRPYDPQRARELLAEAAEEAGIELPLKLQLSVMDEPRPYMQQPVQTAAFVKDSLEPIGIDVETVSVDFSQYIQQLSRGDFHLGLIGWSSESNSADDVLGNLLVSSAINNNGGNNSSRYRNPVFDQLIEEARRETDDARRQALYVQAQEMVLADVPVLPLVHTQVGIAQRQELVGYELHPLSLVRLRLAHFRDED